MKYILYFFIGLSGFVLIFLIYLSMKSRYIEYYGVENGKLLQCPDTQNCICTEDYTNKNYQPLRINLKNKNSEWANLKYAITESGGEIQEETEYYLRATFVTPIFLFVDDFEARLDTLQACIHLRSASRVGDYDFGTNLKRVNRVVRIYKEKKSLISE